MEKNHGTESRSKGGAEIVSESSPFDSLPEECISKVISFTSPRDACVSASVSKTFESAVNSDCVWDKFLPIEYQSLIPQSKIFSSKKELYFGLCDDPVLIEDGQKSFWLEKASGKRCIMLSATQLAITRGHCPKSWQWISIPESRFVKVPTLIADGPFNIGGVINTRILSPKTLYSAYIVYQTKSRCYAHNGFLYFGVGLLVSKGKILNRKALVKLEDREDGWIEIEIGEFFNDMDCDEIALYLDELKYSYWNRGLIIQGLEFRPV